MSTNRLEEVSVSTRKNVSLQCTVKNKNKQLLCRQKPMIKKNSENCPHIDFKLSLADILNIEYKHGL